MYKEPDTSAQMTEGPVPQTHVSTNLTVLPLWHYYNGIVGGMTSTDVGVIIVL